MASKIEVIDLTEEIEEGTTEVDTSKPQSPFSSSSTNLSTARIPREHYLRENWSRSSSSSNHSSSSASSSTSASSASDLTSTSMAPLGTARPPAKVNAGTTPPAALNAASAAPTTTKTAKFMKIELEIDREIFLSHQSIEISISYE